MLELPTGTVTFLFTDIEGSTRLLNELGHQTYRRMQDDHGEILRGVIAANDGVEVRTEGDSFFAVFLTPEGAFQAAVEGQRKLAAHAWPGNAALRVRMGMHTGVGILGGGGADYVGIDVNRAARIAAAGHGGQVLLSHATRALVEPTLPVGVMLRDLGQHRLKDIDYPEHLHDLIIDGLSSNFPAVKSLDVRPTNLPSQRTSFVGRDKEITEINELLGRTRLLTLTGPGGTGKTRLALRVAGGNFDLFPDGVFIVDLSATVDPTLVLPEIAAVLRLRETPRRDKQGLNRDRRARACDRPRASRDGRRLPCGIHRRSRGLSGTRGRCQVVGLQQGQGIPLEGTYCKRVADGLLSNVIPDTKADPQR